MSRTANDVLADVVELDGADVLDVGCGAGDLVRWLRARGARATGVECGPEMLARALAADPDHTGSYVDGVGQDLPFDDDSFDLVVFSASLHHVPVAAIPEALAEAARVVRPGGRVFVREPAVEPPDDDVLHPFVDESDELAAAQVAVDDEASHGLRIVERFEFDRDTVVPDFDEWLDVIIDIERGRAEALEAARDEIRGRFERVGERGDDGWRFVRRSLVAVLEPA